MQSIPNVKALFIIFHGISGMMLQRVSVFSLNQITESALPSMQVLKKEVTKLISLEAVTVIPV